MNKEKTMIISDYTTKTTIINFAVMMLFLPISIAEPLAISFGEAALGSLMMMLIYSGIGLFFGFIFAWLGEKPFFYRRNMVNFCWVLVVFALMQITG